MEGQHEPVRHDPNDPVTRISPREREGAVEVSGGTWVRNRIGGDGEVDYRFIPATREIARRLLREALGSNGSAKQTTESTPPAAA